MKFKSILSVFTVLLLTVFIFNGCGGGSKQRTVTIYNMEQYTGAEILAKIIRKFEKDNPDIKINNMFNPFQGYHDKLNILFSSGSDFDIFEIDNLLLQSYVKKGVVFDLSDFVEQDPDIHMTNYIEMAVNAFRYDDNLVMGRGRIYGFPKDYSFITKNFVNVDIFQELGVDIPTKHISHTELGELTRKLNTEKNGQPQTCGWYPPWDNWWIIQSGGRIFSEDGKKCVINSPENFQGLKFYMEVIYKYKGTFNPLDSQRRDFYGQDKIAIRTSGLYMYPILKSQTKVKWATIPGFYFKGQKPIHIGGTATGWAINKDSKNKRDAWKFYKYLIGEVGNMYTAKARYNIPIMKKWANSEVFLGGDEDDRAVIQSFLDELKYQRPVNSSPYTIKEEWQKVIDLEKEILITKSVMPTDAQIREVLRGMEANINKLIQEGLSKE